MNDQYFWNSYKRLEKEVMLLSDCIHIDENQLKVYSMRIGDLLIRAAIEAETLVKNLYHAYGGEKPGGKDLYFDTDCFGLLENKWKITRKQIYVTSPYFYFGDEKNKILTPLHKAHKRGSSSSDWQKAYQAVKHDRALNLSSANIGNLLKAMGALYILNVYYRDIKFAKLSDVNGSSIDWSLGSELFSVKISPESNGFKVDGKYVKKQDFDECIYLIKRTDDTIKVVTDLIAQVDREINDQAINALNQSITSMLNKGTIKDSKEINAIIQSVFKEKKNDASKRVYAKRANEFTKALSGIQFEAILNKNQF